MKNTRKCIYTINIIFTSVKQYLLKIVRPQYFKSEHIKRNNIRVFITV